MIVKGIIPQEYGSYTWIQQTILSHNMKWKLKELKGEIGQTTTVMRFLTYLELKQINQASQK